MKTTKQDLELRCARLERENEPLTLALNDLCNDRTVWFGRGDFRLGISRPAGAAGGIVIVKTEGSTSAHYWETYSRAERAHLSAIATGHNDETQRDILRRRDVIEQANAYVRREQHGIAAA